MALPMKDINMKDDVHTELFLSKHIAYITEYTTNTNAYEYRMSEYLRLSGIYWATTATELMGAGDKLDSAAILDYVVSCRHDNGGYSPAPRHDAHLLYTLSAIQICATYDRLDLIDSDLTVQFISSLQKPEDGSFRADDLDDVDTRYSFCAVMSLVILGRLDAIDTEKAVEFIVSCMNFDGGFGRRQGSESHAGQVYCCVGVLSLLNSLHLIDADTLGFWLCERQLPSGGLNGRPEKLPDVCYSWWVLSSLAVIGRLSWIDKRLLTRFILASQDHETGGFADRPGDCVDPFHTLFGIAGLSLLDDAHVPCSVHPVFCLPVKVTERLGVRAQILPDVSEESIGVAS